MIQGGGPESKRAPAGKSLGSGGQGYNVPAEIQLATLFHKRGALSAARLGDEVNPAKESSGSQFYIVCGKVYKAAELKQLERQMKMQQELNIFNALAIEYREEVMNLRRNSDRDALMELQDKLGKVAIEKSKELGNPTFTPEQVVAYTTQGGTPFLDAGYTVFGEVEEGLDVVEAIQNVETSMGDRPKTDVVMNVTVLEQHKIFYLIAPLNVIRRSSPVCITKKERTIRLSPWCYVR